MRQPPRSVVIVARTHWIVGAVIAGSTALLYWLTRKIPGVEFRARTYEIAGALAAVYLGAGTLVWFGVPLGPLLSRVCALLYLPRPRFGSAIWGTMNLPEFKAHFRREPVNTDADG